MFPTSSSASGCRRLDQLSLWTHEHTFARVLDMDVSFESAVLERIRRSVVLLAPGHPAGLDREAAIKVLEELQRLQGRDRRIKELLDEVVAMLEAG